MKSKPALARDAARQLRLDQTDAEQRLWSRLRNSQLKGFKFRRQYSIGPFFADFFCLEAKLVIELDGSQHADEAERDERRTAFLRDTGYTVLRFWNHEISSEFDEVVERITEALEQSCPTRKRRM
jgi:adenine-specific DNA-methyltransferase